MDRPYVICHILTALDGKIDGEFFAMPETLPALKKYGEIRQFYDCKATIYGTTTVAEGYSDGILTEPPSCEKFTRMMILSRIRARKITSSPSTQRAF